MWSTFNSKAHGLSIWDRLFASYEKFRQLPFSWSALCFHLIDSTIPLIFIKLKFQVSRLHAWIQKIFLSGVHIQTRVGPYGITISKFISLKIPGGSLEIYILPWIGCVSLVSSVSTWQAGVPLSILACGTFFRGKLISLFCWFKKS